MTPERHEEITNLCDAAMELAPDQWAAFLDSACASDQQLRREVDALLALNEQAGTFIEVPAISVAAGLVAEEISLSLVGTTIGCYQILSLLGAGGMGEVYRARDTKLRRDVAIKVLPKSFENDQQRVARFLHEARALAALNHPNIGAIYGFEDTDSRHALVLELVEGSSLADRVSTGGIPIAEALVVASQVAHAMEAAHRKGIVHCDLKSANIKITPEGVVKVLDFGLAKMFETVNSGASQPTWIPERAVLGTPAYMSPEQARGNAVDRQTDIWAFGCVLYELLSGRRPFQGDTTTDIIAKLLDTEPDWQLLPSSTPERIQKLLRRCLQKDPQQRLRDIRDARLDIEESLAMAGMRRADPLDLKHESPPHNRVWSFAGLAIVLAGTLSVLHWRSGVAPKRDISNRAEWVQLTNFSDSVSQPALSSDGKWLSFIRGSSTFFGPGDLYLKRLPDGEPVQLTRDNTRKMSPVFSPDGSYIAYTVVNEGANWDTSIIPIFGSMPRRYFSNASGLTWTSPRKLLFSEIKKGMHMAIVESDENRSFVRDIYVPATDTNRAHRSYPSPDGKSVLVVEQEGSGAWLPCRLLPFDRSSSGRSVGPVGPCTFAGWSPDGAWMYFSAATGGSFHTWRQRFPDGSPVQMTSGPGEEQGIAVAPDGRSLITSVGLKQRAVWLHDAAGDRQISLEGYAFDPKFTVDGESLLFRILKGSLPAVDPTELWIADLKSGTIKPLLPGLDVVGLYGYDISPDGTKVVVTSRDHEGKSRLWLGAVDQRSQPRQLSAVQGDQPRFDRTGEIFFRSSKGTSNFIYRIRPDGTGLRKAFNSPIREAIGVSPDGHWIFAYPTDRNEDGNLALRAYSVDDGPPILVSNLILRPRWSQDRTHVYLSVWTAGSAYASGRTYIASVLPGHTLPHIPSEGFHSERDIAAIPGVSVIDAADVAPGPIPSVYAFSREVTQRNLYRIPIQ